MPITQRVIEVIVLETSGYGAEMRALSVTNIEVAEEVSDILETSSFETGSIGSSSVFG